MHRFLSDIKNSNGWLDEKEAYHANSVLRLKEEDRIVCFDGKGWEYLCEIEEVKGKDRVKVKILEEEFSEKPRVCLTLILALYKISRLEWAIEKCTEIGVDKFVVTKTRYSPLDLKIAEKRENAGKKKSLLPVNSRGESGCLSLKL